MSTVSRDDVRTFMQSQKYAVQASVTIDSLPQAAVVGIAVTDSFEVVFDTLDTTRKAINLRRRPRIAFVIGGLLEGDERTVQYEGLVDEPTGEELERVREIYFARFPDGRDRLAWIGITHFRARPKWIRFSDYTRVPPVIAEFIFDPEES